MAIAFNSKQNIGFSGLNQNIEQSRQIVASLRKEIGRPKSDSFVDTRILQHKNDTRYADISNRLRKVCDKHSFKINNMRLRMDIWDKFMNYRNKFVSSIPFIKQKPLMDLHKFCNKLYDLVLKTNSANCDEINYLLQYEHLKNGIKATKVWLKIFDKSKVATGEEYSRDHVFLLRNLSPKAVISRPETWGNNAIVVDGWAGSGIASKALDTPIPTYQGGKKIKGESIEGGLKQILDYMCFDPEKETASFIRDNHIYANNFIFKHRNNLR